MQNPVRSAVVLEVGRNELHSAVRVDAVRITVLPRLSAAERVDHRVAADCGQHSEFCPTTVQAGHCEDPELRPPGRPWNRLFLNGLRMSVLTCSRGLLELSEPFTKPCLLRSFLLVWQW